MSRLRRFMSLSWSDRTLLITTFMLLAAIRLALWTVPFQKLRRILQRFTRSRVTSDGGDEAVVDSIGWAVETAARYVPRANCLPQALTAQVLLMRRGLPAVFRLGVRRDDRGRFEAHAWVEWQGRVVVGGRDVHARYAGLPDMKWGAQ